MDCTLTFVLGDVVASTRLWEGHPDAMAAVLARLDALVDAATSAHGGHRPPEQGEGDNFVSAFGRAADGVAFAAGLQAALTAEAWPAGLPVTVRMAVHTGHARLRDGGRYMGEALNRCARLRALGHGGQVLVSGATTALVVEQLGGGLFLRDLGTHQLRDLSQPERITQLCGPGLPFDFPALRSLDRGTTNLPVQLTSFVGRAAELADTTLLLADRRLLTLAGAGGCGKTRLAVHLAAEVLDSFADGVWFVDLGPLTDPDLVAHTVAAAAGVKEVPGRRALDTLAEKLAGANALVVLDNCEHLLDGCATVAATLLQRCPSVRILATSREPLGLEGETTYRIPSLGLPGGSDDLACESVVLFTDRAALARPTLRLGPDDLAAVAAICTRLDGIPLAIELAAARCRALTPRQIADRLGDHFGLLTGGSRRALPRHRALEASIEWSYGLLTDDERALLRRLSVFSGGFDLTAAEAVGAASADDRWAVVDLLTGLVDKSLVLQDDTGRYRLLETVRQFAEARLVAGGEAPAVRRRHAEHFAAIAAAAEDDLYGPGVSGTRRRLRPDVDNLRAAADFAVDAGNADLALGLVVPIDLFWQASLGEARERAARALALEGATPALRTRGFAVAAEIECMRGDFEAVAVRVDAGLRSLDGSADPADHGWLLELQGWTDFFLGRDGAEAALRTGLHLLRRTDSPRARYYTLDALWGIALNAFAEGRTAEALATLDEALASARAGGAPVGIGRTEWISSLCRVVCGGLTDARDMTRPSVVPLTAAGLAGEDGVPDRLRAALVRERALQQGFAVAFGSWGIALLEAREAVPPAGWPQAVDEAEDWMTRVGFLWGAAWARALRAQNLLAEGDLDGARARARKALEPDAVEAAWAEGAAMSLAEAAAYAAGAGGRGGGRRAAGTA